MSIDYLDKIIIYQAADKINELVARGYTIYVKNPNGSLYELKSGFELHVYPSNLNNKED